MSRSAAPHNFSAADRPQQAKAQLEFLTAVNPDLERVAILSDLGVSDCMSSSNREAARGLLLEPQVIRVEAPSPEYDKAFAAMERERAQALIVLEEPINQACRKQIADLAAAGRLPTVFPISMVDAGGSSLVGRAFAKRRARWHSMRTIFSEAPVQATYRSKQRWRTSS